MNEQHLGISFPPFDAADYLDDEETIAEYLTAASENPNPDVFADGQAGCSACA